MNKIYYERPQNHPKNTNNQKDANASQNINNQNPQSMEEKKIEDAYFQPSYQANDYSEQEREISPKSPVKEWIANGILIVLSIMLVINLVVFVSELSDMNYSYERTENELWQDVSCENYIYLFQRTWMNRVIGVKETEGLKQCYAIADYFEAASLYKVAEYTGNAANKEKYAKIMEEKLLYFDDIMYVAEDINEKLGIK